MTVYYNGKIFADDKFHTALAVEGEIIAAAGGSELLERHPAAEKVDLEGRLVLPGFNDSHLHLFEYALEKSRLSLRAARSAAEVIAAGRMRLKKTRDIVVGVGYNDALFAGSRPLTRDDLDKISADAPVIVYRVCGHAAVCNGAALRRAGLDGATGDLVDSASGIAREQALELLKPLTEVSDAGEIKALLRDGIRDLYRHGITSVGSNDIDDENYEAVARAYRELYRGATPRVRVNLQATISSEAALSELAGMLPATDSYLRLGAVKVFADGSLGAKTAYLKENYRGENHRGILTLPEEELARVVRMAAGFRLPVLVHAIGDGAIDIALRVLSANKQALRLGSGVVHAQVTDKKQLKIFRDKKIRAFVQPAFINTDVAFLSDRVGRERAETSYAFGTLYRDTVAAFGSDAPVESANPFRGLFCAVARSDFEGRKYLNPAEALTLKEAVMAYTAGGAEATGEKHVKGKLKAGYYADFIVLDTDIFSSPPAALLDVKVVMTVVGGKIVYRNSG